MAKKAFALRLDEAMLSALQRWADDEFRSVNGQIEYLLHQALQKNGRLPPFCLNFSWGFCDAPCQF